MPTPAPITLSHSPQSSILGKWRHGLPEQCPPSMDARAFEELKKLNLPENKTCYFEFFDDGHVICTTEELMVSGTYKFIGDKHIEIIWNHPTQGLIWALGGNLFKVDISGDKMTLTCGGGGSSTFRRVR